VQMEEQTAGTISQVDPRSGVLAIEEEKIVNRMAKPEISHTNCATTTGEILLSSRAIIKRFHRVAQLSTTSTTPS